MINFPPVKQQPIYLTRLNRPDSIIDGHKAIVNPGTGKVFGVVSADYVLTPHEQMIETIQDVIKGMPEFGEPTEEIKLYDDGSKMRATYIFKDVVAKVNQHDVLHPQIEVFNSYDSGWSRKIFFGAYRLVCTNGLTIGERAFSYRTRHDTSFRQEDVKDTLIMAMERFSDQQRIWESWVNKITMPDQYDKVISALPLSNKDVEAIGKEVEISSGITMDAMKLKTLSVWMFFNIVCQYVTHSVNSHLKRAAIEGAMRRAFIF